MIELQPMTVQRVRQKVSLLLNLLLQIPPQKQIVGIAVTCESMNQLLYLRSQETLMYLHTQIKDIRLAKEGDPVKEESQRKDRVGISISLLVDHHHGITGTLPSIDLLLRQTSRRHLAALK